MVVYLEAVILYIYIFFSGFFFTGTAETGAFPIPPELLKILLYLLPSIAIIWILLYRSRKIEYIIIKPGIKDLIALVITYPALLTSGFAVSLFASLTGTVSNQAFFNSPSSVSAWILISVYCLLSALLEESFFRYYLLVKKDELRLKIPLVIAISVFLFSVCHLRDGLWGMLNAAIAGFVLCLVFIKFKSFYGIVTAHWFYNMTALIINAFNNPS